MKKIIMFTILAGLLTACTVENEPIELNSTVEQSEDIDCIPISGNPSTIMGSEFVRTGFVLETAVDGNGDGVYSTDLANEGLCGADALRFRTDSKVWNIESSFVSLQIDENNEQRIYCSHADGLFPTYIQTENIVDFCFGGEIRYSGVLSDNENTLTVTLSYDQLYGFFLAGGGNDILMSDGTVSDYEGNATIIYTRL